MSVDSLSIDERGLSEGGRLLRICRARRAAVNRAKDRTSASVNS